MKLIFKILFMVFILPTSMFGQIKEFNQVPKRIIINLSRTTIEDTKKINELEGEYLNSVFAAKRGDLDFRGKKVAFLKGYLAKKISSKKKFLDDEMTRYKQRSYPNPTTIIILKEYDKKTTNGYDAIVVYMCEKLPPIEFMLKKLGEM